MIDSTTYYKPVRIFDAYEGDWSVDEKGPEALKHDLRQIEIMFDPTATHDDETPGGITFANLMFNFGDEDFASLIGAKALEHLQDEDNVQGQLYKIVDKLKDHDYLIEKSQWMMALYINEDGHLTYEHVNGLPTDFEIDSNGHLMVEVLSA